MANKDHSLDKKIVAAARAEFMEHGFQNASLRKIADRAGITTGALYTRYKNKDGLFCSLVETALGEISKNFEPMRNNYILVKENASADKLIQVIRQEERVYLDILYEFYDECILFLCRSDGSSVSLRMQNLMANKATETVAYLKSIAKKEFDADGIEFLLSEQFHYYKKILEKGFSKERAVRCMKTVENFLEAGWRNLFEKIL